MHFYYIVKINVDEDAPCMPPRPASMEAAIEVGLEGAPLDDFPDLADVRLSRVAGPFGSARDALFNLEQKEK